MPALDTNVLVRYLVRDDEVQLAAAQRLIAEAVAQGSTLHVPVTVALELEWVLRSRYGFGKADVLGALSAVASAAELSLESEQAVEVALQMFRTGSADFADCLHVALTHQAGALPLWTFDRAAARLDGASWLDPDIGLRR